MKRKINKHFCSICKVSFDNAKAFMLDRQQHISKGETKKQDVKSKTTTK